MGEGKQPGSIRSVNGQAWNDASVQLEHPQVGREPTVPHRGRSQEASVAGHGLRTPACITCSPKPPGVLSRRDREDPPLSLTSRVVLAVCLYSRPP